jgi:hypothetical protein
MQLQKKFCGSTKYSWYCKTKYDDNDDGDEKKKKNWFV